MSVNNILVIERRKFLKFAVLLLAPIKLSLDINPLETDAVLTESKYILSFECTSKIYPDRIFSTVQEFWQAHSDDVALDLNSKFENSKRLLNEFSYLCPDQRTVVLTKEYMSKKDHELYMSQWNKISNNSPKEEEVINYRRILG